MKKKEFNNRLEAIDWIAEAARDEGHFEVLREQLHFNYIYTGRYFIVWGEAEMEVVGLNSELP